MGTPSGVDRFRQTRLTPVVWPGTVQWPAVAPDSGGRMWAGAQLGTPVGLFSVGERVVPRPEFRHDLLSLRRDLHGGLWLGGDSVWERRGNAFVPVPLPPPSAAAGDGHTVQAVERDRDGRLWVSLRPGVLRRGAAGVWEPFGVKQGLGTSMASVITADSSGRTWLGYPDGRVALAAGDSARVLTAADGADVGMVLAITVHGSRVWIGGVSGVAVLDPRAARTRFVPLRTAGEPLRGISGIVETQAGELWMNGLDGVTRIPAAEVRRALREPGYRARYERLDHHDGIEPPAPQNRPLPSAVAGTDGRIWFISARGLSWVDPNRMRRNAMPPPVHLRALAAGGRRYPAGRDTIRLPPRTTPLSVAYTAYSLAVPERVRFRYRLEGLDTAWHDAGNRREAFYTNLPPGRYRFRVIAANEDGVWNTEGASLHFIVAPAWNQTWWFRALVAAVAVLAPAAAALAWQRRRGRLAAERAQARFDAMLAERTRVARELHDTLLGDMAGVAMQLSAGARRAEASGGADGAVVELLSGLGAQVQRTLVEARRSVTAMRAAPEELPPLHERLADAAHRTLAGTGIAVRVERTGSPRPLVPAVEAEILGIATEAMANAREHAGCRNVTVACGYEPRALRVRVRDDGRGFDPSRAAPPGHWGLVGMRERAASVGATLAVASAPGAGTEVALVLPAGDRRRRWWTRLRRSSPTGKTQRYARWSIRPQPEDAGMAARPEQASRGPSRLARHVFATALAAGIGLAGPARAQAPKLAEMDHASWTARDGAPQGVTALAQAPDGTLWVGTDGGLYSFDGRTFTAFQPPAGEPQLPPESVRSLLVTRDGTLWVGFIQSGVARVARGHVTFYRTAGSYEFSVVDNLREARSGGIWAIANQLRLIRLAPGDTAWHQDAMPPNVVNAHVGGLYVDSADVLWLAQGGRLFRRQLPETTYAMTAAQADVVQGFAETPDRGLWMTGTDVRTDLGRTQRVDRGGKLLASLTHREHAFGVLYSSDGSLLLAMDGLRRLRADALTGRTTLPGAPAAETYGSAHGLTSDAPRALLLDADHNVWVGGRRGLDRLRAPRLVPFLAERTNAVWTLCANARGDVFISSTSSGLFGVVGGVTRGFPNVGTVYGVSCGNDGTTRVLEMNGLWEVHGERLRPVPWMPGAPPHSQLQVVATSDRTLYATLGGSLARFGGLWRYRSGRWTKLTAEGLLGRAGHVAHVDSRDRLWMGYNSGHIGLPLEGRLLRSGTPGLGSVFAFLETARGFFAAGTYGLAVLRDTSFQMLSFADRASTRGVAGLVEAKNGDLYLNGVQGIVRVPAAELRAGLASARYAMQSERVTEGDFTGPARVRGSTTTAARAADGTLWFSMLNGVVRYDPAAPHATGRPPVLSIRSITADRVPLGERRAFDPQPRTLAIRYFGVNLTAPDRVRYRYKLDGFDDDWHDAGGRTEAIYTRPGPGTYTFRVMAASEAGAWTAPVSSVAFTVLPAFHQTRWFAALVAATVVALGWLAYTLRVRSITAVVQAREEERADERVRIARELHDTLLSGMAGLMMGLGAVAQRARSPGGVDARVLDELCDQTRRTLVEAREAVVSMRTSTEALVPLDTRLGDTAGRIFSGTGIDVRVTPSGTPRPLPPEVDEQVVRVAAEAMTNARAHAGCRAVEVACDYGRRELVVRVRDDGRGFDPAVAGGNGHYGLVGMRERAASIGATLAVSSAPGAGTEVALVLPAGDRPRRWWTRLLPPGRG